MAKISELVYDVREALKLYSDDVEISNRYIIYLYGIKRDKYLRRELNRFQRTVDNSVLQTFCIPLEEVSANECNVSTDCKTILRSTKQVPKPIDLKHKPALVQVKPTRRISKPFNFVNKNRASWIQGSDFRGVYAFLDPDGYIYVFSKNDIKLLDCLTITGVFSDPMELKNYSTCCDCKQSDNVCYDPDTQEYPMQQHLIDIVRSEIINELSQRETVKEDTENDAEEERS
jgi:hypothetical protein